MRFNGARGLPSMEKEVLKSRILTHSFEESLKNAIKDQ